MNDRERKRQGMDKRQKILGKAHVDQSIEQINEFNRDFQDFITRYAWGEIWSRPGLEDQTRSLITIAVLIALDKPSELRMHITAALRNGISKEQIKEVLLHCAIYCGLPATNQAFHIASELLAEH